MLGQSRQTRAFESARRRLVGTGLLNGRGDGGASVVFTSRNQGDGVSTVVAGIAKAIGAVKPDQLLVIDADHSGRRASEYLRTTCPVTSFEDANLALDESEPSIFSKTLHGLDLLVLDPRTTNNDISPTIDDFLAKLHRRYPIVLIDAGALFGQCAHPWLRCEASTVLVIDSSSTSIEALRRARTEVEQAGLSLSAFILNKRRYSVPQFVYRWMA